MKMFMSYHSKELVLSKQDCKLAHVRLRYLLLVSKLKVAVPWLCSLAESTQSSLTILIRN